VSGRAAPKPCGAVPEGLRGLCPLAPPTHAGLTGKCGPSASRQGTSCIHSHTTPPWGASGEFWFLFLTDCSLSSITKTLAVYFPSLQITINHYRLPSSVQYSRENSFRPSISGTACTQAQSPRIATVATFVEATTTGASTSSTLAFGRSSASFLLSTFHNPTPSSCRVKTMSTSTLCSI
jgi:hypothetical protein